MPRRLRLVVPGLPMHITQRGHDRAPIVADPYDSARFLACVRRASLHTKCAIHAYAVMSNHTHFLVTPPSVTAAGRMIQLLGRLYVPYFNTRHRRSGTLWERRYSSVVVDTSAYFLACCRYIELNPVTAGMVKAPSDYEWSSYAHLGCGQANDLITPHPEYLGLGDTPAQRASAYRAICAAPNGNRARPIIRAATRRGGVLGGEEFRRNLERVLGRTIPPPPRRWRHKDQDTRPH
ncbi:MAG: transposase [Gemmatimonadaceae bacterium]|nr:transposase [Gemmatimonadaceae bacterium]